MPENACHAHRSLLGSSFSMYSRWCHRNVATADPKMDQWPMKCPNTDVHARATVISFLRSVSFLRIWPGDAGRELVTWYLKQK